MKKTKEECLLMNGIMSFDLGKNEARIMKAMDDWAEDVVKNNIVKPDVSGQLPDFLYEDKGQIKIGYHSDTVVTDEWNKWKEGNLR